jgi:hypothetical protein
MLWLLKQQLAAIDGSALSKQSFDGCEIVQTPGKFTGTYHED